ncbi:Uncharacterized protein QTN25_003119 [Entamoeba marina]
MLWLNLIFIVVSYARYPCFKDAFDFSSLVIMNGGNYTFTKDNDIIWLNICEPFANENSRSNVLLSRNGDIQFLARVSTQIIQVEENSVTFRYNQPDYHNNFTYITVECDEKSETQITDFLTLEDDYLIKMKSKHACIVNRESHTVAVMVFFLISMVIVAGVSVLISYFPNQYQLKKTE